MMAQRFSFILLGFCLFVIFSAALANENEEDELMEKSTNDQVQSNIVKREAGKTVQQRKRLSRKRKGCKGKNKNSNKCKKRNNNKKTGKAKRRGNRRNPSKSRRPQKTEKAKKRRQRLQRKKKLALSRKNKQSSRSGKAYTCADCLEKFRTYAKIFEGKATVIVKQVTRIKGNDKIQESKKKKKGDFNGTATVLLSALGGNISKPTCDGVEFNKTTSNKTRAILREAPANLDTLTNCNANIEKACNVPLLGNATLNATLTACEDAAKSFKTAFSACLWPNKTQDAACTCVFAIKTDTIKTLQACDTSKDNDKALKLKKACKKAVGTCKTAQGESVESVNTCKPKQKCGGAKDKAEAEKLIKILAPLAAALSNPAVENALKAAGLNTGSGSDGYPPTTSGKVLFARVGRAADGEGCKAIEKGFENFNKTASKAVGSGPDGKVDDKETTNTIDILNGINNRTDLVGDLKGCAKEGRQISGTVTVIVRIRIYFYWCLWFRVTIVEVKITVLIASFPSVTTPAPAVVTTKAPLAGMHKQRFLNNLRRLQ